MKDRGWNRALRRARESTRRARERGGGDDGVVEVGGGTRDARAVTSGVCLDDDDGGVGVGVGAREDAGETTRAALESVVREETRRPVYARDGGDDGLGGGRTSRSVRGR